MKTLFTLILSLALQTTMIFTQADYAMAWYMDEGDLNYTDHLMKGPEISADEEVDMRSREDQQISFTPLGYHVEDLTFQLKLTRTDFIEIRLYDQEGQQVKNIQTLEELASGAHRFKSNISRLEAGEYLLVVSTPKFSQAQTISIL
ncbi:MAG: hypothetical protein R3275_12300 [Saprospiraceae bacterium]|nr:hypothetical protein [Saprospiraceae bacterium]